MELETIIYCNSLLLSLSLSLAFCYFCVTFIPKSWQVVAGGDLLPTEWEPPPCKSINAVAFNFPFADEDDATTSAHNIEDSEKRVIFLNQQQPQKYCNNHISTAKYRLVDEWSPGSAVI